MVLKCTLVILEQTGNILCEMLYMLYIYFERNAARIVQMKIVAIVIHYLSKLFTKNSKA